MNTPHVLMTYGIVAAVIAAAVVMLGRAWPREMRRRREQAQAIRAQQLAGGARLRPDDDTWRRSRGRGQISLLAIGGYASSQLPFILREFGRAGASDHIGIIYLLDLDEDAREQALASIPKGFRARIVEGRCPLIPGGGVGDPIPDVLARDHLWRQDVMEGGREWLRRIQTETEPVLLLTLLSSGGMAAMGQPVQQAFHQRYPELPIYVTTLLDQKTIVRKRFPAVRQLYAAESAVRGTILTDNRRYSKQSDLGIAMLFAAMVGATWMGEHPLALWNGLAYVFPTEQSGGFATISVWAEMLPVYHLPANGKDLPAVHYTKAVLLEEKAIRGIRTLMEHPELQSLPLEPAELGRTRVVCTIAPIVPSPDFQVSARRIKESLESWRATTDQDLSLQFASIGAPLMGVTETPIVVVLLQPVAADGEMVDALADGTHTVDAKFLPAPRVTPVVRTDGYLSAKETSAIDAPVGGMQS